MAFFDELTRMLKELNPAFAVFESNKTPDEEQERELEESSVGTSEEGTFANDIDITKVNFENYHSDKRSKIGKYREMSNFPEVSDALDNVVDDAIVEDDRGDIVTLNITEKLSPGIEKRIRNEFAFIINDVLDFNEKGWDFFRKFIVDSELYLEKRLGR